MQVKKFEVKYDRYLTTTDSEESQIIKLISYDDVVPEAHKTTMQVASFFIRGSDKFVSQDFLFFLEKNLNKMIK